MISFALKKGYLLLISILIFSHMHAQDNEYEIAAIRVEGTTSLDRSIVASLSGLRVGQSISIPGQETAEAIKLLWKQGLFSNINLEAERYMGKKVFLLLRVEEKPRIGRYQILGIRKGEVDELRPKLDIRSGAVLNENLSTSIKNTIRSYYKEKGFIYPNIQVNTSPDTFIKNGVLVTINIDRGYKYKVKEIQFIGNENASNKSLKKAMSENKETAKIDLKGFFKFKKNLGNEGWTWYDYLGNISPKNVMAYTSEFINPNIFRGAKYKPEELRQADKKGIRDYYSTIGYRDAHITWDTAVETDHHRMNLTLKVDEGRKYYYRNIDWVGNTKYSDSILSTILNIKKGDIYNAAKMEEKLQQSQDGSDVSSLYMDDGYLFFQIDPQEVAIVNDSVDILMRVYEGNQSTINNINIFGNDKTNEKIIRRELRIKPGDKFDRSKLIRTQREISALNYFNPEKMQIVPKPKEDGTVDIDLTVEEKPSDQLSLSLGYAAFVYGQVGLNFTNFSLRNLTKFKYWKPLPSGDGQTFALNLQSSGLRSQVFNISFTEPWLGGKKPTSLTVSGTHSRFNNMSDATTISGSYIRNIASVEVGTRLKWPDDYFVAFFGVTLENSVLKNYPGFTGISDGVINNFYSKFTLTRNCLQGPIGPQLYPTSGSNISFSVQATLPYSLLFNSRKLNYQDATLANADRWNWIEYHKWKLTSDVYTPIAGNLVARFGMRFGTLGYYNGAYGISPFERFKVGGDGLVAFNQFGQETYALRGYADDEVTFNENGKFFSGATVFNKYIFELRYPISLNPQSTIYGMLFAEGGNGWDGIRNFDPFYLKKSVGAGVRFFLPMFGLLGFDYGFGMDKNVPSSMDNASIFDKYGKFRFILGFEPQ